MRVVIRVKTRRAKFVPLAGAALAVLAFAGCTQSPEVAARVGSETITVDDLDLMTQALCTEQETNAQAATPESAVSTVRGSALAALIQTQVDAQYAAANDLPEDGLAVAQQLERLNPLLEKVPAEDRDRTRELIRDLFQGQQQLFTAVVDKLKSGGQQPSQEVIQQAIASLEADYSKKLDIDINPRFDSAGADHQGDGFGSLSHAVSTGAKAATSDQPDPAWAAGLPASQKCG
jgi:hypothetical protein